MDAGFVWSVVLAAVGLFGVYLTGKFNSWGWAVGLFAQVLWSTYALTTGQYGFLVSAAVFGAIYGKNWLEWRRKDKAPEPVTAGPDAAGAWLDMRQALRCKEREEWDSEYRGLLGQCVTPTKSPSLAVTVNMHGGFTLTLPVANPIHPRIDTVCTDGNSGRVVTGIPSARPVPPAVPVGFSPVAHITVPANTTSVTAGNIQGVL